MRFKISEQDYIIAPKDSNETGVERIRFVEYDSIAALCEDFRWVDERVVREYPEYVKELYEAIENRKDLWGEDAPSTTMPQAPFGYSFECVCTAISVITEEEFKKLEDEKNAKKAEKLKVLKAKSAKTWDKIGEELDLGTEVLIRLKDAYCAPKKLKG